MSDTLIKIKEIIVDKLGGDEKKITDESHFIEDLGADSLDTVELIMQFEEDFNDIIQGLDRVSAGLQAITDEFETLEPLDAE